MCKDILTCKLMAPELIKNIVLSLAVVIVRFLSEHAPHDILSLDSARVLVSLSHHLNRIDFYISLGFFQLFLLSLFCRRPSRKLLLVRLTF